MQCIGEAFGVDPNDPAQQEAYSTKPANLLSIFEVYLKTKSKTKAQVLVVVSHLGPGFRVTQLVTTGWRIKLCRCYHCCWR